jgi:hypothetical protein
MSDFLGGVLEAVMNIGEDWWSKIPEPNALQVIFYVVLILCVRLPLSSSVSGSAVAASPLWFFVAMANA